MRLTDRADEINKIFQDLKPFLRKGSSDEDCAWSVHTSSCEWYVTLTGHKCLEKLNQTIFKRHGVDESDIDSVKISFIEKMLFESNQATVDFLREKLQSVEDDIKQRELCVAVYGLEVENGLTFDFGKISFHARDLEKQAPKDTASEDAIYSWGCLLDEGTQLYMQGITRPIVGEHVLALEYLYNLFETDRPEDIAANFVLDFVSKHDVQNIEINRIRGNSSFGKSSSRRPVHERSVEVTSDKVKRWEGEIVFQKLSSLLKEGGKIKKRVMMAIFFLHDSVNETRPEYKILKSVIGIEALLGTSEDNHLGRIASSLGEKVAFLLETDLEKRLKVIGYIKDIYGLRSGIGHGRGTELDDYDAWSAEIMSEEILIGVINKFLKLYSEKDGFKDESGIDDWYRKKKMS